MTIYITLASHKMQLGDYKAEEKYPYHNEACRKSCCELMQVWKESFQDEDEYIKMFFQNRFVPQNTVVAVYHDQIIGAAYLLPAELITEQGMKQVMFGYALGVLKEYRGKGLGKRIIDFICSYCEKMNYSFIFYPANERLVSYYESLGLSLAGYIKLLEYTCDFVSETDNLLLEDISAAHYANLRNVFFNRNGFIKWEDAAIDYAIREIRYSGGFCNKLTVQSTECAVFGKVEKEKLNIMEVAAPDHLVPVIVKGLSAHYKALETSVYVPTDSPLNGRLIKWIMGYKIEPMLDGYCNLLLN